MSRLIAVMTMVHDICITMTIGFLYTGGLVVSLSLSFQFCTSK